MSVISTNPLGAPSLAQHDTSRLKEATADFEAIFVRQLFAAMRKASNSDEEGLFAQSHGEKLFSEMLDGEYADMISRRPNGLGLKEALFEQLSRRSGAPAQQLAEELEGVRGQSDAMQVAGESRGVGRSFDFSE